MTFTIGDPAAWDEPLDALDEAEWLSLEEQDARNEGEEDDA